MKNVTYLFGAGASANAVPVQKDLAQTVTEMSNIINSVEDDGNWDFTDLPHKRKVKRELFVELEWLANQIKNNGTPDVLAENLTRQKKFNELRRLKIIYSAFLVLIQCSKTTEQRYIRFVNRIMDMTSNQIRPNVRVLSWNYDFQLERGFSELSQSNLWQFQQNNGFYQSNNNGSIENARAAIFNLNGTASFYDSAAEHNNKYDFDYHATSLTKNFFDSALRIFGTIFHVDINFRPHLSFSWENNLVINSAIKKIEDTQILVVVGYSFPDENRTVDSKIIAAMTDLDEIHIQDRNAFVIKGKLTDLYLPLSHHLKEGTNIIERTDESGFYIPNDLY